MWQQRCNGKLKVKSKNSKIWDDTTETFELNEDEKPYKISHRCFYFSKGVILFIKECMYERI
jgi:hypothetical protein